MTIPPTSLSPLPRQLSLLAGWFAQAVGLTVIAGWWFHVHPLKSWLTGAPSARFNAAVCLVLLGFSLGALRTIDAPRHIRIAGRIAAATALFVGALTLLENLLTVDFGIDQLLHTVQPGEEILSLRPGLIPPLAGSCLVLLSLALLMINWKNSHGLWISQFLAFLAATLSTIGILDFLLETAGHHTLTALPSAVTFLILSLGLVSARLDWVLGGLLTLRGTGGMLLRRATPIAVLVLNFVAWLESRALLTTAYLSWVQVSLVVVVLNVSVIGLIAWAALLIQHAEDRQARAALDLDGEVKERQRTEVSYQETASQLSSIISSAMDAIIATDENQRVLMFNAAAEEMFRCRAEDVIGQPLERFLPARYRVAHPEHYRRFGESGFTARSLGKLRALAALRADGEEFQAEIAISKTASPSRKIFTAIVRDVTDRKQAEAELASKAEELARSNRDLEQFAYVASHDLQEPLRMVASYTQLLAERYRDKLDQDADKYIAYALEGALRMQTLIQDLLAFSRVGRNGNEEKKTDCNSALEETRLNLRAAIEESQASIVCDELPDVAVPRSQVVQLLQNLIGNAIKFRGTSALVIRVAAENHDEEWMFTVADNGIGIAPEHRDAIFVIFQRLHTRAEYPGNGVGLAICKKIVEQHGGRIWVESELNRGSTFQFSLPAWREAHQDLPNSQPDKPDTCTASAAV